MSEGVNVEESESDAAVFDFASRTDGVGSKENSCLRFRKDITMQGIDSMVSVARVPTV